MINILLYVIRLQLGKWLHHVPSSLTVELCMRYYNYMLAWPLDPWTLRTETSQLQNLNRFHLHVYPVVLDNTVDYDYTGDTLVLHSEATVVQLLKDIDKEI